MALSPGRDDVVRLIERARAETPGATVCVPVGARLLADQLTPVLAYRRLVVEDERTAPSFLLESVEGGERQGRYSILGARPALRVVARGGELRVIDSRPGREGERAEPSADPLAAAGR